MEVLLTESKQDECINLVIQRAVLVVAVNHMSTTTGITASTSSAFFHTMILHLTSAFCCHAQVGAPLQAQIQPVSSR